MKLLITLFALAVLLFPKPTLAGGQLVSLQADLDGWTTSMYGRVVRLFIGPGFPCKGTEATFKFTDSKDGDYVMTGSGSATYTFQDDRGPSGCGTYAKMGTKNSEARAVTVSLRNGDRTWEGGNAPTILVHFDGQHHNESSYNQENYRASIDDPYVSYYAPTSAPTSVPLTWEGDTNLNVWVLSQENIANNMRNVLLKWSALNTNSPYGISYDIYGRKGGWGTQEAFRMSEGGPSASITIPSNQDYFITVTACLRKVGTCINSNELYIARSIPQIITSVPNPPITISLIPPSGATGTASGTVDELNKKIASLQGQLNESKQRQSILEQTVNNLMSFMRRLFPFFR